MTAPAGWYANPNNADETMWWDGTGWDLSTRRNSPSQVSALATTHEQTLEPLTSAPAFVLTVGDIGVTPNSVVTPSGSVPLAGTMWVVEDHSWTRRRTPTWAVVFAVIGFLVFLLGLLFLLVREDVTSGFVEVRVFAANGSFVHCATIPVWSPHQVDDIRIRATQAQTIASALR